VILEGGFFPYASYLFLKLKSILVSFSNTFLLHAIFLFFEILPLIVNNKSPQLRKRFKHVLNFRHVSSSIDLDKIIHLL